MATLVRSWGKGLYKIPHTIRLDRKLAEIAEGEMYGGSMPDGFTWFRRER